MEKAGLLLHRLILASLAAAGAIVMAGCAVPDPPMLSSLPAAPITADPAEPPPGRYLSLLQGQGLRTTLPAHGKLVVVNIPSFELVALQDGVPVLRSRVVVGHPATPTPELVSSMVAVQFNPGWTPTPSMIRNEGAHYIPPGPQNPLGRMMFDLDNDEFIYLHDTNERALFNQARRAFSHGCIRVEQARALAAWSLGISEQEVDALIARGSHTVPIAETILVALVYQTRFPDEQGTLLEHADLYASRR